MNSLMKGFNNISKLVNTQSVPVQNAAAQPNIFLQAIGAALRHESPQDFMQRLAQQHPLLKQYDLSNLQQTAAQVCQQNGINMQDAINQIDNITSSFM